jgi:hypothetical protein
LRRLIENIRLVIVNYNLVFTWCKDARTPEAVMTYPISPIMLSYRTFDPGQTPAVVYLNATQTDQRVGCNAVKRDREVGIRILPRQKDQHVVAVQPADHAPLAVCKIEPGRIGQTVC